MEGKQLHGNETPVENVSNSKACHKGNYYKDKYANKDATKDATPGKEGKPFDTPKEKKAPKAGKSLEEKWKDVTCHQCGEQGHKQRKCPKNEAPAKGETTACPRCDGKGCILANKDERKELRLEQKEARKAKRLDEREQKKAAKQALEDQTPTDDLVSVTAESTAQPQVEVPATQGPTGPQWKF